jgi:hypothetical protein
MARTSSSIAFITACALACFAGCDKGPSTSNEASAAESKTPAKGDTNGTEAKGAAASTEAPKLDGKSYGSGVKLAESVAISKIVADPKSFDGKTVRVEGMVIDVCPKRGCWFEMAGDAPGKKMRFKVQDGVMVFPMEAKGKYAVAEGVVSVQELSLEQTKKHAAYQAEEKGEEFDPASVTEAQMIVRIDGTGAVVRDQQ